MSVYCVLFHPIHIGHPEQENHKFGPKSSLVVAKLLGEEREKALWLYSKRVSRKVDIDCIYSKATSQNSHFRYFTMYCLDFKRLSRSE